MIPHSKPCLSEEEIQAAVKVLESGNVAVGPEIELFEDVMAGYIGKKHAIAVTNGTAALHMALIALEIAEGDEVIFPASVCPGVMHAVEYAGATPVLCDVNDYDLNLSLEATKTALNEKTKAIILPHMYGISSDIDGFKTLDVPIIEDCAQSLGGTYKGTKQGAVGDISTFSFYATKMMTSIDGGMVMTDDDAVAALLRDVRYYGGKRDYKVRYNYKLQNLNAAIGLVQAKKLDAFVKERREQHAKLKQELDCIEGVEVLDTKDSSSENACYKLLIHLSSDDLRNQYLEAAVKSGLSTNLAIFEDLKAFRDKSDTHELTNLNKHLERTYSFPIYPGIDFDVLSKFLECFKQNIFENSV